MAAPLGVKAWRNAVLAIFTANGIAVATLLSRLPGIRDQLELEPGQVGFFLMWFAGGSIVGLLFSGQIVHALGPRRAMRIALPTAGLGLALAGIGAGLLELFAVAVVGGAVFGAFSGINDVSMNVDGAANERAIGRNIMPWFHAGFSLGAVIGAGLGSAAAAAQLPIWLHFLVAGAFTALVGLVAPSWSPREDATVDAPPKPSLPERLAVWKEPRTLLIGVLVLCFAYVEGGANDWLALALVDGRGFDEAGGALMLGVFTAAMTLGRIAGPWVLDRFGRVPVLTASGALAVLGLALVIWIPSVPVIWIGTILWGLGAALGFPVGMSAAADIPSHAAARVSAVAFVGYLAFLAGPPVIGFVGEHIGVLLALVILLGLSVVAVVVAPAARPPAPGRPTGARVVSQEPL